MTEATIISLILGIVGVLCAVIGALLLLGINKTLGEMKAIWEEIKVMQEKQTALRAELPVKFLRVDGEGYKFLVDSLKRIERHSEEVASELHKRQDFVAGELHKRENFVDSK